MGNRGQHSSALRGAMILNLKSKEKMVGGTGIEPVTPTMSRYATHPIQLKYQAGSILLSMDRSGLIHGNHGQSWAIMGADVARQPPVAPPFPPARGGTKPTLKPLRLQFKPMETYNEKVYCTGRSGRSVHRSFHRF